MSRDLVILGAGGHAKVAVDACRVAGIAVRGLLDRDSRGVTSVLGATVLGDDSLLAELAASCDFHVAITDAKTRLRLADQVIALGGALGTIRHPGAIASEAAEIGPGGMLAAGSVVNPGAHLGRCVIVNTAASVDHDCDLGDGVHVAPGARLAGAVVCGKAAFIGAGAVILPGVTIGAGATVGAGAVVTRDAPDGVTLVGVPARVVEPERKRT